MADRELLEALGRVLLGLAQGGDLAGLQGLPVQPLKPLVLLDVVGAPVQHAQPPGWLALQQPPNQILQHAHSTFSTALAGIQSATASLGSWVVAL